MPAAPSCAWVTLGDDVSLTGFPDTLALWILALGACWRRSLATLSLITRKNSRHPLARRRPRGPLGILILSWRVVPLSVGDRALTVTQAIAIVNETPAVAPPAALPGIGIYLGLVASIAIAGFGLTIVVKRVARPYVMVDPDDDVFD